MSEPFLGQIEAYGFSFAPRGWATCDGQLLQINQYQSLYSLLGTMYGGDGRTTFALPDLRGRVSLSAGAASGGSTYQQGEKGGSERTTLTAAQTPSHTHTARVAAEAADSGKPGGNSIASATIFKDHNPDADLQSGTITAMGSGQPIGNIQPYLALNWCIALQGVFPSRN